ncbi:putative serine/threonine protein kinase [Clavispora lusitaniae]|uniref:Serine/threonine protein kinase n=1 Tax=Clavispora lusitaniae TaxID=36911 RepID=A0AA91Q256_CLALS|nr:putative serine/threonine protein kinase [Clavispora lusitaniae]
MEAYERYDHGGLLNDRYLKVADISEGSYGLVSLAKDTRANDTLVAVKYIYPASYTRSKTFKELSQATGRATSSPAKLRSNNEKNPQTSLLNSLWEESAKEIRIHKILGTHPNITSLIDHFDSCLVLEYCARGDLYEAIQSDTGPSTTQDVKDVFGQILSALAFCHGKSVFHRDLKPENILITEDWTIKMCDWGLATTQRRVTNKSEFDVGSERYMAPELFDPELESYDAAKVDLWSVGIILLTLVFHKNPFKAANYTDKRFLQFSANREALFDFFSTMSSDMFSVLRFCLTLDPENRDLEALRAEVEKVKFFTMDEEYWAEHSDEEEDYRFEAEAEDEQKAELAEKTNSYQKPVEIVEPDVFAEPVDIGGANMSPRMPPQITVGASLDADMPYNRRADALLSPHAQPIPIGRLRNTRKPFGVASYTRTNNSHSNNGRFRREDFFTPRSVFNHYMDKYGENKYGDNKSGGDNRDKERRRRRSGKQSWKRKPETRKPCKKRRSRYEMAQSAPHTGAYFEARQHSPARGKYVPPFLRSPRSPPIGALAEEIDHLSLDDDMFQLEDVGYTNGDENTNGAHSGLNYGSHLSSHFNSHDSSHIRSHAGSHVSSHGAPNHTNSHTFNYGSTGAGFNGSGSSRSGNFGANVAAVNGGHAGPGAKYVPPFRRGSHPSLPKRAPLAQFARSIQQTLDEGSHSVPSDRWMTKNWPAARD